MRWVLESCSVKQECTIIFTAEAADWHEMTCPCLLKDFSSSVSDHMESFSALSCVNGSSEKIEISLMNVCWNIIEVNLGLQLSSTTCDLVHNNPMLMTDYLVFRSVLVVELLDYLHVFIDLLSVR